jgi:hypothetical protein
MTGVSNQIVTTARLFADGAAIDQTKGHQLLLWHDGHGRVSPAVDYRGEMYTAMTLNGELEHLLRLPAGVEDFGSVQQLIADLGEVLTRCPGLDGDAALLAAVAIQASWLPECLPGPLIINPWGPPGTETALVDLLACLCRRPLRLAEPSLQALASLPVSTLILQHPNDRTLRRLEAAVGMPKTCFVSGGELAQMRCAIVAVTSKPITLPAITIPLTPAAGAVPRIRTSEEQALVERFSPRLLHFRVSRHTIVSSSQFDAPGLCPEVRTLARTLGAVLEGEPELQSHVTHALHALDEQQRGERSQTTAAVVLESILALLHAGVSAAYIGRICDLANDFLENREERMQLSPKAVGEILRREFGIVPHRRAPGFEADLDTDTQRRIHGLASAYGVLQHVAGCPRCEEMVTSIPTENAQPPAA